MNKPGHASLAERHKDKIAEILARYPNKRAALLPLLWLVQEEQGYVSEEAMAEVGGLAGPDPPAGLSDDLVLHNV